MQNQVHPQGRPGELATTETIGHSKGYQEGFQGNPPLAILCHIKNTDNTLLFYGNIDIMIHLKTSI